MILIIYAFLMAVSLILLIIGYTSDSIVIKTIGFGFLFIVNSPLVNGDIEYPNGHTDTVAGAITTRNITYETYEAHTIAFFLCILGVFGLGWSVYEDFEERKKRRED